MKPEVMARSGKVGLPKIFPVKAVKSTTNTTPMTKDPRIALGSKRKAERVGISFTEVVS
jgi:hypothetical protein